MTTYSSSAYYDLSPSTMRRPPPYRSVDWQFIGSGKDAGKPRIRESYARPWRPGGDASPLSGKTIYILPDALAWRTYLPWIQELLRLVVALGEEQPLEANAAGRSTTTSLQWILTESVVTALEYRNQAWGEAALSQERGRLVRFVTEGAGPLHVRPFPDACVRDEDYDEDWDDLRTLPHTSLSRSRLAALRVARLVRHEQPDSRVYLWMEDLPHDDDDAASWSIEAGVSWVEPHSLLELFQEHWPSLRDQGVQERLDHLRVQCRDDYFQRQEQATAKSEPAAALLAASWTEEGLDRAYRTGRIERGRYQVSSDNPSEAFVKSRGKVYYIPPQPRAHAVDQDTVWIEPLPVSEWERPVGRRRLVVAATAKDAENGSSGDTKDAQNDTLGATVATARVIRVQETGHRRLVVATLTGEPTLSDEAAVLLVPMDVKIPKIRVQSREWHRWLGQRLLVEIVAWDDGSHYPAGHVQTRLGAVGDLETEVACLLHEHRIPLDPWSLKSRACLPPATWKIPKDEILQRRDLRKTHSIFSVDPVGCQDIDDCMHARRLPNGQVEIGVHIADVTHFVPLGSALDLQARQRGTTFYLVDRRFDMLPSVLSSNLCSLHGGCDRLAVSVIWTLTRDMSQVLDTWYGRTIIHNVAAMTYDQADRILADLPPEEKGSSRPPPLTAGAPVNPNYIALLKPDLEMLTLLARRRRQERQSFGGAVDLSSADTGSELKFSLVDGQPVKVQPKQTKEIHRTIEELMIFANTSVATKIKKTFPEAALLRIHRAVEEERFEDLNELLRAGQISFKGKTNAELAESLQRAQEGSDKTVASLFRSLATRAMSEALYVSTGLIESADRLSHYGLGLKEYTHFTSPIRRYADVIVHWQLLAALDRQPRDHFVRESQRNPVLARLPNSTVMSVFEEDDAAGVSVDEDDFEVDMLIGDVDIGTLVDSLSLNDVKPPSTKVGFRQAPFQGTQVASICEHLNEHNRLAKHSSMACQGLFLSLYFRNHIEYAEAVVTDLRENGFFCYIPKFDMRGPVFLHDRNGYIHMDPAFFDLPSSVGMEPTRGFASSGAGAVRRFDPSESEIWYKEKDRLEVFVRCRSFIVKTLDVVNVSITCPDWDNRARVPLPRIQLVHKKPGSSKLVASSRRPKAADVKQTQSLDSGFTPVTDVPTLFDLFTKVPSLPASGGSMPRPLGTGTKVTHKEIKGRFVLGGFVNPDTRSAAQAAAQEAAGTARGDYASLPVNEYDANNRVARDVTARQQRLAAGKRNTRKRN